MKNENEKKLDMEQDIERIRKELGKGMTIDEIAKKIGHGFRICQMFILFWNYWITLS